MFRCINLDWLEVYCLESNENFPHDAAYFSSRGIEVVSRPYGTRVYAEMFTIYDENHQPSIEVRRNPMSAKKDGTPSVLSPMACHVRLVNRSCYRDDAASYLRSFLMMHGFLFQSITRVDLCLDFERFDKGDDPADFMRRFMAGRFSKINQANISAHGIDQWDSRVWNSVSWGSPKSMVTTKFYCKSLELAQVKDKPYIRQAWAMAHLVDDFITLTKQRSDGRVYKPAIWRVEFSLRSSVKGWVVLEDCAGKKKKLRSVRNTLGCYETRPQLLDMFASLADKYFHFVKYKNGVRKDRCERKVLFDFTTQNDFYKIERPATSKVVSNEFLLLLRHLKHYRESVIEPAMIRAIDGLVSLLEQKQLIFQAAAPWDENEVQLLRRLIAFRLAGHTDEPVTQSMDEVKALLRFEKEIWDAQ